MSLPLPDSDSLGEPTAPQEGLDCYLDSLFSSVLSCGEMVGMGGVCANNRHSTYTPSHTHPQGDTAGATEWHISSGSLLGARQRIRVSLQLEIFLADCRRTHR